MTSPLTNILTKWCQSEISSIHTHVNNIYSCIQYQRFLNSEWKSIWTISLKNLKLKGYQMYCLRLQNYFWSRDTLSSLDETKKTIISWSYCLFSHFRWCIQNNKHDIINHTINKLKINKWLLRKVFL